MLNIFDVKINLLHIGDVHLDFLFYFKCVCFSRFNIFFKCLMGIQGKGGTVL